MPQVHVLIPQAPILRFLAKRSAAMPQQGDLSLEPGDAAEHIDALNDVQKAAIQAALRTLFEAALSVAEDSQDEQRQD